MPSPIAHSVAGYVIQRLLNEPIPDPEACRTPSQGSFLASLWAWALPLLPAVFFSLLPDFDFLPGVLTGRVGSFHNQFSHSLLVGAVVALVAGLLAAWMLPRFRSSAAPRHTLFIETFWLALLAYNTHILMDFFTMENRGVKMFWPLTEARFAAPVKLFYGVRWSEGLFSPEHLITILTDLGFAVLVLLGLHLWKRRKRQDFSGEEVYKV